MHAMFFFRKPPGGPPAGARRRTRLVALAAAVITGLGTLFAVAVAAPALAQAGTPPYWAQSPFNVPSGTGATVPFTEYEAESASTTGTIIGPSFAQGSLPSEASGREAVQLTATGQYVKFTLTSPANAFDLHYALNQGASGTLSVYVNGTKLSQELNLTSAYSYITTGGITGSMTHKFYDDARMMFGQTYPAGHHRQLPGGLVRHGRALHARRGRLLQRARRHHPARQHGLGHQLRRRPDRRERLHLRVQPGDHRGQQRRRGGLDPDRHLPRQLARCRSRRGRSRARATGTRRSRPTS